LAVKIYISTKDSWNFLSNMQTNFIFLQNEWPELLESAIEAEKAALSAPGTSAFSSRFALEQGVFWLYDNDPGS
jgi:type I restriction enzyme, R subunit